MTIDTKPSNLSPADKKAVEDAEDVAATIEDLIFPAGSIKMKDTLDCGSMVAFTMT